MYSVRMNGDDCGIGSNRNPVLALQGFLTANLTIPANLYLMLCHILKCGLEGARSDPGRAHRLLDGPPPSPTTLSK